MTTAREVAEEVCIQVQVRASQGERMDLPVECAKAASDVWTAMYLPPIALLMATKEWMEKCPWCRHVELYAAICEELERAKEVLGDDRG